MLEILKKVHCFSGLDDETLQVVHDVIQPETFEPGERLCTEDETGDKMFIIESGEVAVLKAVESGDLIEVAVLDHGAIAGEMGLFGHRKRLATLQARNECKVWALDYIVFDALLEEHPIIARRLLSYVCDHLIRETSTVAKLMAKNMNQWT